jgi:hypothetical protein
MDSDLIASRLVFRVLQFFGLHSMDEKRYFSIVYQSLLLFAVCLHYIVLLIVEFMLEPIRTMTEIIGFLDSELKMSNIAHLDNLNFTFSEFFHSWRWIIAVLLDLWSQK